MSAKVVEEGGESSPWQLQKEEILLLMSVYCGEGECVVTCKPESPSMEQLRVDDLSDLEEEDTGKMRTFCVCVKLAVLTDLEPSINVQVQFSLPHLYPISEVPVISITSDHVGLEDLTELTQGAISHSTSLLPQPCMLDVLEKIKDDIMRVQLCDTMRWSDNHANVQSTLATNQNKNMVMPCQQLPHGKFKPFEVYVFLCGVMP